MIQAYGPQLQQYGGIISPCSAARCRSDLVSGNHWIWCEDYTGVPVFIDVSGDKFIKGVTNLTLANAILAVRSIYTKRDSCHLAVSDYIYNNKAPDLVDMRKVNPNWHYATHVYWHNFSIDRIGRQTVTLNPVTETDGVFDSFFMNNQILSILRTREY